MWISPEVEYGDWQGKSISELQGRKMWAVVQEYPSRARFPNGETMRGVQARIVNAVEGLVQQHPGQMIALVFHADLIKMALAHYLGMHLDVFQRIVIFARLNQHAAFEPQPTLHHRHERRRPSAGAGESASARGRGKREQVDAAARIARLILQGAGRLL